MSRLIARFSIIIFFLQIIILVAFVCFAGNFFSTPNYSPINSDVIVILGGEGGARLNKGIDLYRSGYANKLLITGFPGLEKNTIPTFAKWRLFYILENGVPEEAVYTDSSAKSSKDEAEYVCNFLLSNNIKRALIVSDPPHLRRLSILFDRVFKQKPDLEFRLIASSPEWWVDENWWRNSTSSQFVLMELIKTVYYFFNDY